MGIQAADAALGVDAAGAHGWVGVVVGADGLRAVHLAPTVAGLIDDAEAAGGLPMAAVGVDIPIGAVAGPRRRADEAARAYVGARRNSVFWTPHRAALEAVDQAGANRLLGELGMPKVSAQAWNLVPRIREVAALAAVDHRVVEVFPEASFRAMADAPLAHAKKQAGGALERLALLAAAEPSIALPSDPAVLGPAARVVLDDLFDAAAAAWSAWRVARGIATRLGDPEERDPVTGRQIAVWV